MPVVPINPDYSNVPKFVDSMFDPDVRSLSIVQQAINAGGTTTEFAPGETPKIISVWTAAWQVYNGLPYDPTAFSHCQESDRQFIRFLSQFLRSNNLCLIEPDITYSGPGPGNAPVYTLNGYKSSESFVSSGTWQMGVVNRFLTLLYCGAHFVFIQDKKDLPPGVTVESFYSNFTNSTDLKPYRRHDPGNSHYTSGVNICGYYVPVVSNTNTTPNPCPFFLALLVGPTDSGITCNPSTYSTFMQLEGWEALASRHNADYDTIYKPTLWNISTYGACAYSEKRATTVFLAPPQWIPKTNSDTIMAPYAGAETRQAWLDTSVVKLG